MAKLETLGDGTIPPEPDTVRLAAEAHREAAAALEEAQDRHRAAVREYQAQEPGAAPTITAAQGDELGGAIAIKAAAEQEAEAALREARAEYRAEVRRALAAPLSAYETELAATLDRLEHLIEDGARFHVKARAARAAVPSKVPAACRDLARLVQQFRAALSAVSN